jgi:hypothetical protein
LLCAGTIFIDLLLCCYFGALATKKVAKIPITFAVVCV